MPTIYELEKELKELRDRIALNTSRINNNMQVTIATAYVHPEDFTEPDQASKENYEWACDIVEMTERVMSILVDLEHMTKEPDQPGLTREQRWDIAQQTRDVKTMGGM